MSLRRALDYPYDIPKTSYLLNTGKVSAWDASLDLSMRIPVLGCGSNQSPTQLLRKFGEGTVPVMAGWLAGYDSVYSAHFTSYGSIAATYHYDPSIKSRQVITWLDQEQLQIMHDSEALGVNYEYVQFEQIEFEADCGMRLENAYAYQSLRGCLKIDGQPAGLESIKAMMRPYPSKDQEKLQIQVMELFDYKEGLASFVAENITDLDVRTERTTQLMKLK